MTARNSDYYDFGPVLSRNGVFNFVPGGRGIGKTYGAKKLAIRNFMRRGDMFIYVRRYKEELQVSAKTFFADIEHEFPDYDFRINGREAQCATVASRDDKKRDWQTMGFFIALSITQQVKSTAFPKVKLIIFDEFIAETSVPGYLPKEYTHFLNFYNTVARRREGVIVLFLANAVSMMNPYFIALKIEPDKMGEFTKLKDGFVVVHLPDSDKYRNAVYATRFGAFIQGSEYAEYAVENAFEDANDTLVGKKTSNARHEYNLMTSGGEFSVWFDRSAREYYILDRLPKDSKLNLTLEMNKMKENRIGVNFNDPLMSDLRTHYRRAQVKFQSPAARNAFAQVFNR